MRVTRSPSRCRVMTGCAAAHEPETGEACTAVGAVEGFSRTTGVKGSLARATTLRRKPGAPAPAVWAPWELSGTNGSLMGSGWRRTAVSSDAQHHGHAPIGCVLRLRLGHRHGVGETGDFSDLPAAHAVFQERPPGRVGAARGEFPVAIIFAQRRAAALGVAFQLDVETGVTGNFPGQRGENPFAVVGELLGVRLKNRLVSGVKHIDAQPFRRQVQTDVVLLVLRIALQR